MSNFDTAIITILKQEGGYSDNAGDPGGPTNFGITQMYLDSIAKDPYLTQKNITKVTDLQQEDAIYIYRKYWWTQNNYEKILDQRIATKLFSIAVNEGERPAVRCLQRAVRAVSGLAIPEDGDLGLRTTDAINKLSPAELLPALRSEVAGYYRVVAAEHPKEEWALVGWLNRAYS